MQLPDMYFIVGIGRSGTTLLNQILNANPHCLSTPETKFVMTFYEKYADATNIDPDELLADMQQYYGILRADQKPTVWQPNQVALEQQLHQRAPLTYADACKLFLLNLHYLNRSNENVQCIIDKNPAYVPYLPQLMRLFPEAKFIISLRDYRAVLNSDKQSKGNRLITPMVRLLRWRYHFGYLKRLSDATPDRFLWLKYENLVNDNEASVRQICHFLAVPFDPQMLQSYRGLDEWIAANSEFLDNNPRQKKKWTDLSRPITPGRAESWRQNLTTTDIALAELLCGGVGKKMGYEPTQSLHLWQKIGVIAKNCLQLLYALPVFFIFAKLYFWLPLMWRLQLRKKIAPKK